MTDEQKAIIEKLKAYAQEHYNDGGWDVYVECYDDAQWLELIGERTTYEAAFKFAKTIASVWAERQADARYEEDAGR